jgi:hypothetical protein
MWKIDFWRDSIERAVKTFAQATISLFTADTFNVLKADFGELLAVSLGAALVSLLTSLASSTVGDDSPSLVFPKTPKE